MDDGSKRIADYFVIASLPDHKRQVLDDRNGSSSPTTTAYPEKVEPITDVTVIVRSAGEQVPPAWYCIETTPTGFPADLNHGSIRSPSIFVCYRRGRDKPPLVDIGVLFEGKERVMADSEVVHKTLLGRPANVNNSGSKTFLTFRRAKENAPCNQLVVMDICVLLMNKGETPPHAYCLVRKNLNKGIVGSDVYLCYKKSMNRPPLIRYEPRITGRFPLQDYPGCRLPHSVPLFCMPMGATIEVWPRKSLPPRPVFSTFVLTSDTAVKVYGAAVTFYEKFDAGKMEAEEMLKLDFDPAGLNDLYAMKSLCILSRWPFFDTFENFLLFLYREMLSSSSSPLQTSLEELISHFMLQVPFPSPQRPKILVQLKSSSDDTILVSQPPEDMPLPLSGASFSQMLRNLGPENCMNLLVLSLAEQKILLHSLRPDVLTGVAEAVTAIIFPFVWQCPYIPLCPLGLCDVLNAPLPFIVGVDSRYFDLFVPPNDVVCVDLDTNSIYLSESKKSLNSKALPKKPARVLRNTLDKLYEKLLRPNLLSAGGAYASQTSSSPHQPKFSAESWKKYEQAINRDVQEAFLKFMSSALKGFRSFLRPIIRAPTVGATDPSSLFDLEAFAASRDRNFIRFYQILMKTQMFAHFVEERSFTMDKDSCLAFFDHCLDLIEDNPEFEVSSDLRLIDVEDLERSNDRTVFIPAPETSAEGKEFVYQQFGPLDPSLFHALPDLQKMNECSMNEDNAATPNKRQDVRSFSPLSKRTKQEVRAAQRVAKLHAESPVAWAKTLLSYVYSLWFIQAPAYVMKFDGGAAKAAALRMALEVLIRMEELNHIPFDETCYRVLMLLCGEYSQPVLAVKVLFEMRRNGVIPNAITYGYYNKAVLESVWPAGDTTASILWSKVRNVVLGVNAFKQEGRTRAARNLSSACEVHEAPAGPPVDPAAQSTSGSKKSDLGYASDRSFRERLLQTELVAGKIFKDCKTRRGSVVSSGSSSFSSINDYNSIAGVLMTCQTARDDDVFPSPDGTKDRTRSKIKKIATDLATVNESEPHVSPPAFLRSYSFGNDAKMIRNLQAGTLKALKHELERNHQCLPEEDLVNKSLDSSRQQNHVPAGEAEAGSDAAFHESQSKSLSMPESFRRFSSSAFKSHRSASVDGWFKSRSKIKPQHSLDAMSPIKDVMSSLSFFSSESAMASLKSGLQYAVKLTESPAKRAMSESRQTEGGAQMDETDLTGSGHLHRSRTVPCEDHHTLQSLDESTCSAGSEASALLSTPQSDNTSPWTKSLGGTRVDYWNSTLKSAATSVASRFSEIKNNLSANSPAKFTGTISQWANMMAEKIPANLVPEDDDDSSDQSFDMRRTSSAVSDDEMSERSRDGSVAKVRGMSLLNSAAFEVMERHFDNRLGDKVGEAVLVIEMSSCCRCYACATLVFDEEIMEGWSADDSNLNTQCVHCASRFVPLLTVTVVDKRDASREPKSFTVPYLSPLVLRKEVENVLEHEGDMCLLQSSFVDAHPIIYWNLIWYFERTNLPSHLPGLALPSSVSFLPLLSLTLKIHSSDASRNRTGTIRQTSQLFACGITIACRRT